MPEPTVCAVMLTRDRPEYARRAWGCFEAQTYAGKFIVTLDTSGIDGTVGAFRNKANSNAQADIIVHWDDDDWSHPNRIAEQVALLQSSGAECVGYNKMLFWRLPPMCTHAGVVSQAECPHCGESWLYRNGNRTYALGTSLCYWRSVWERRPFENLNAGEDAVFIQGLRTVGVNSVWYPEGLGGITVQKGQPRMIARIHAGNTAKSYSADHLKAREWHRVPEWDDHCRKVME